MLTIDTEKRSLLSSDSYKPRLLETCEKENIHSGGVER